MPMCSDMPPARPRPARAPLTRRLAARATAVGAALACGVVALPASPAQAVSKSTLWNHMQLASDDLNNSKPMWYTFPTADRLRWSSATTQAGKKLSYVRARLSAADTQREVDAVAPYVYTERKRARTFFYATRLAGVSLSARKSAVNAGQTGFTNHLAGKLSDAGWAEVRADSAAVAALAAKDRRRAWAALLTTSIPTGSEAQAALSALSTTTRASAPSGWIGVPGGCAVQTADATWLGSVRDPGVHLWTDGATVAAAKLRGTVGPALAQDAHDFLLYIADKQKTALTSDLTSVSAPLQQRSQRLGYAALMGDSTAASWLRQDLSSVLPPGPRGGNVLRDAIALEALATELDWTGQDEALTASTEQLREAMLVRWVAPLSCRYDDLEATVVDDDNISIIVGASLLQASYALAHHEPALAAALVRTARLRLAPGIAAMTADGGSYEGPSYFNYQGRYLAAVYGTTAAVHGDTPPLALPSAVNVPTYAWNSTTYDGDSLAFSDSLTAPERLRPGLSAWVAHTTGSAAAGAVARDYLQAPTEGFHVLWWPTDEALSAPTPARTTSLFRRTGLAVLQAGGVTAWLKGGDSRDSHAHLDLGSVGYARYGVQWAVDPGQDDYGLPEYSSRAVDSKRWTYWKVAAKGHSGIRPTTGQPPLRTVPFSQFGRSSTSAWASNGYATVDLRGVMPGASSATRQVGLSATGQLTVSDRVRSSLARQWQWGWVTEAAVSLSGSGSTRTVTLSQAGRTVRIGLSGLPYGSTVGVVSAPSGVVGPTGRALRAVVVTTGKTTFLALNARVS